MKVEQKIDGRRVSNALHVVKIVASAPSTSILHDLMQYTEMNPPELDLLLHCASAEYPTAFTTSEGVVSRALLAPKQLY